MAISLDKMRFSPDRIVSRLSEAMTLRIGDLIFLGAAERVDVVVGDNYRLTIGDRVLLDFDIKWLDSILTYYIFSRF